MSGNETALKTVDNVCCGEEARTSIFACSGGGSNVGRIANNLMVELGKIGPGNANCLAGVGAGISGFVETAKAARTIVIDGCPIACAKKIFEKQGITPVKYFVVTEMGIKKTRSFEGIEEETTQVLDLIKKNM
jgi:uncharacterized metal-binding protein